MKRIVKMSALLFLGAFTLVLSSNVFAGCPGPHGPGPSEALSDEDVLSLLRHASFPETSLATMLCIAKEESGKYPEAFCNDPNSGKTLAFGIFQMQRLWFKQCSNTDDPDYQLAILADPQTNANCAYRAFRWARSAYGNPYMAWEVYSKFKKCHNL